MVALVCRNNKSTRYAAPLQSLKHQFQLYLAITQFEVAATVQDALGYMEPPYWYYPTRQSLGAALLSAGKNEAALSAFTQALQQFPNSGWVLFGLMNAQQRLGDEAGAARTLVRFEQAWTGDPDALTLDRL